MSRPSDGWKTAEQHELKQSFTSKFWSTIPFDSLERYAESLRATPSACFANRQKYAYGAFAIVIELVFDDGEVWVARLVMPTSSEGRTHDPKVVALEMDSEAATLKYVRDNTTITVPTIFSYSATADNILGLPFTIMSAIQGASLVSLGVNHPADEMWGRRARIAECYINDLASITVELSKLRFDRIGSLYFDPADPSKYVVGPIAHNGLGPFDTAFEYYSALAKALEEQCLSLPNDTTEEREGRAFVLWLFRLGLSVIAASPDNNGPFLLSHNDVHQGNVLCNKQGRIEGLIDWGHSAIFPLEAFITQCRECCTNTIITHDPQWKVPFLHRFGAALSRFQAETSPFPSGRTLEEAHSSAAACLFGTYKRLLESPSRCSRDPYAKMLIYPVLGTMDVEASMKSTMFKEWYESTLRRIQSTSAKL